MDLPFYREFDLPWTSSSGQERKFRRLLAIILGAMFFLGVWYGRGFRLLKRILTRWRKFRRVLRSCCWSKSRHRHLRPSPSRAGAGTGSRGSCRRAGTASRLRKNRHRRSQKPTPEPAPEPEIDLQAVAREQAQAALLPFTEDLAALADSDVLETVADNRPLTASVGEAARNERSMITSKVGTASEWRYQHGEHEPQHRWYRIVCPQRHNGR